MIEERAIVSRLTAAEVWVRAYGPESCPRCAEGKGCGGGVLARLVGRRRPEVCVNGQPGDLRPGDTVIVGVDEDVVMRASVWVYLVPLVCMFTAGSFAQLALAAHDLLVAAFGLTGLVGGFLLTHLAGQRAALSPRYRPTLLRRVSDGAAHCPRIGSPD